jgi:hypothetical protein
MRSRSRRSHGQLSQDAARALKESSIGYVLRRAQQRYSTVDSGSSDKKNYSEEFSRSLAQLLANILRDRFEGIQPSAEGSGHESLMTGARGSKKIDVRYSTPDIGLGFVISIKTTHFRDRKTRRDRKTGATKVSFGDYNHNETRFDAEFRAEAAEIHERNPFGELIGLFVLPEDSALIFTRENPSSFAKWVRRLRFRAGREKPDDRNELFEKIYVGLYKPEGERAGEIRFFDVQHQPPIRGLPREELLTLAQFVSEVRTQFENRNNPPFQFGEATLTEDEGVPIAEADIVPPEEEPC